MAIRKPKPGDFDDLNKQESAPAKAEKIPAKDLAERDKADSTDKITDEPNAIKRFIKILGPGLITGASDDDPSGIGTYATAGAAFGFATLWTALITFPMMAAVQYI